MNIKERIKQSRDIKTEMVTIKEWDDVVIEVKTMTAKQRAELFQSALKSDQTFDQKTFQMAQIIASCYDPETKQLIFDESDVDWLMEKSSGAIEKLLTAIAKVSGLGRGTMELAEKN